MNDTKNGCRSFRDLPGPFGLTVLGNLHQVRFARLHLILEGWEDRYGPIYRISLGAREQAVVSDPDAIGRMLGKRPHGFRRARPLAASAAHRRLGPGLRAAGQG